MNKNYLLDFDGLTDRRELHCYIQNKLKLPAHYGKNLDALSDCLWEISGIIVLRHIGALSHFGEYGEALLGVFREVDSARRNLRVIELDDDQ